MVILAVFGASDSGLGVPRGPMGLPERWYCKEGIGEVSVKMGEERLASLPTLSAQAR
jgi:hypothetical protein